MLSIKCLFGVLLCAGCFAASQAPAADFNVSNNFSSDYVINGVNDPALTLVRGRTYTFSIAASGHPFWIKTNAVTGTTAAYTDGITGNGIATGIGTLTFAVPLTAPNQLVYICQFHSAMQGLIRITNPPPTAAVLSNPRRQATGEFAFDVAGTPGRLHRIEATTNVAQGWTAIASNSPVTGTFTFVDNDAALNNARFYRVTTQ